MPRGEDHGQALDHVDACRMVNGDGGLAGKPGVDLQYFQLAFVGYGFHVHDPRKTDALGQGHCHLLEPGGETRGER
jgi:hypothetical protein